MLKLPHFWPQIPNEIKARFGQKHSGRQRAMAAEGHLLLVLHKAPRPGSRERQGVFFWRKPDGSWDSSQGGGLLRLTEHVDEYELAEAKLSREYEHAKEAEDYFQILAQVAPLHHAAKSLHHTLQAAREAIPDDRDLIDLRDEAYDLERTLDLLYLDAKNALDFYIAKQSEAEARLSMRSIEIANRLNVLAAIFFPLTALASIFGMNLHSGVENSPIWTFWAVLLVGVVLGLVMSWWALRGAQNQKAKKSGKP